MSSLYSVTTQEPPVTVVAAPVSSQLSWTSNGSSTSSSEVFSLCSVGSSTFRPVTLPSRMPWVWKSVTGVSSAPDRSWFGMMISSCKGLLRGLPARATRAGTGDPGWLPVERTGLPHQIHPACRFDGTHVWPARRLHWGMFARDARGDSGKLGWREEPAEDRGFACLPHTK